LARLFKVTDHRVGVSERHTKVQLLGGDMLP
jgi:hypothetical protein